MLSPDIFRKISTWIGNDGGNYGQLDTIQQQLSPFIGEVDNIYSTQLKTMCGGIGLGIGIFGKLYKLYMRKRHGGEHAWLLSYVQEFLSKSSIFISVGTHVVTHLMGLNLKFMIVDSSRQ